jgi:DUF4097 and DUF4098 domain-containing protein YvlB
MASPTEIDTTKSGSMVNLPTKTGELEPYLTKEFILTGPGILRVSTLAGNIEVERVADTNKVRIELYVDRGYAIWSNTKNLENYRITTLQRGNEIFASVEQKSTKSGFFSDQMKFSYKIFVPKFMSSEIKTSAGDIMLSGMEGQHMIKTGNGKIIAKNIQGKLGVYSASGNIRISNSSGTLYAQTEAGKLSVADSQGEIRLKTNAGNVSAQQISGSLLAKTGSGNMDADFIAVSTGISLETNSGNIRLRVPASFGYNLNLSGTRVRMADQEMISGSRKKNEITGTINGGGATINLSTKSGEVTLDLEH